MKKSLMENFIFCAVKSSYSVQWNNGTTEPCLPNELNIKIGPYSMDRLQEVSSQVHQKWKSLRSSDILGNNINDIWSLVQFK